MSPLDAAVVRRKLEIITANLRLLQPIAGLDLETYRSDPYRRKATERMLQEIVEAATDINVHIVVRTGGRAPDGLHQSFFEAATCGVLSHDLAAALSPSAGLRNRSNPPENCSKRRTRLLPSIMNSATPALSGMLRRSLPRGVSLSP